jgi:hypothetical protein
MTVCALTTPVASTSAASSNAVRTADAGGLDSLGVVVDHTMMLNFDWKSKHAPLSQILEHQFIPSVNVAHRAATHVQRPFCVEVLRYDRKRYNPPSLGQRIDHINGSFSRARRGRFACRCLLFMMQKFSLPFVCTLLSPEKGDGYNPSTSPAHGSDI